MMSKKQWFVLFCLFVFYLLLGASIFFYVEAYEEIQKSILDMEDKQIIEELMKKHYQGDTQTLKNIFNRLSIYCGKPVSFNMTSEKPEYKWDFYHSLFFVITVVSTIGYGNLAPTTMFTRIFMIFYALIGIPMNGILMVALGEYFGKSFKKLYRRWKSTSINKSSAKLGLIGQIILYAVPGLTFFIFLPSTIISVFEGWDYYEAVYFSFVTLTTIGFGDFVAGAGNVRNFNPILYRAYEIFMLIWIIGGIGYLVMIIGFITQGMRHRKVIRIERILAENIKKTPQKIRHELRSLLHEFLFQRVKPVYKGEFEYVPHFLERSQSCPDISLWSNMDSPSIKRKRAMSECVRYPLHKVQSETDLERIDKERTFRPSDALMRQKDLILKVVDALANNSGSLESDNGIHGFSDSQILASERTPDDIMFKRQRRRALSEVNPPAKSLITPSHNMSTWYGSDANTALHEFKKQMALEASSDERINRPGFLKRIKNRLNINRKDNKSTDVEKQILDEDQNKKFNITSEKDIRRPSFFSPNLEERRSSFFVPNREELNRRLPSIAGIQDQHVLEQTSIADFIRALSAITVPEQKNRAPRRKFGIASLTPPMVYSPPPRRSAAMQLASRRSSAIPASSNNGDTTRRCSLMPLEENVLSHLPPPYSESANTQARSTRRFSIRPTNIATLNAFTSPVKYQLNKRKKDSESDK